jgi:hypothetical protein
MIKWIMDQKTLKQIGGLIDAKFDSKLGEIEAKLFAWKSEIIDSVDGLAKEVRDSQEFREISSHQTSSNIRRIEKLEKKVFGVVEA